MTEIQRYRPTGVERRELRGDIAAVQDQVDVFKAAGVLVRARPVEFCKASGFVVVDVWLRPSSLR